MHPNRRAVARRATAVHPAEGRAAEAVTRIPFVGMVAASAAVVLLSLIPAPAHAQLPGRLKKLGKEALENAARRQGAGRDSVAGATAAKEPPGATTAARGGSESDYTITDERVQVVLAALTPAVERARVAFAAQSERAAYRAATEKFTSCMAAAGSGGTPSAADVEESARLTEHYGALSQRLGAARAARDERRAAYISDSITVAGQGSSAAMFGLTRKCGPFPYTPVVVIEDQLARDTGEVTEETTARLAVGEPAVSTMTRTQFGMVRERIALWTMQKGGAPADALGRQGVFTEDELAALERRGGELMALAPLFKGSHLQWARTSDLRGW